MPDTLPTTDAVLLRRDQDHVAWLTLNRPSARNALSVGLMTALERALDGVGADAAVRVVVIAGAGPAFCAGHDLREIRANPGRENYQALFEQCSRLMTKIVRLPKPVIARVHGVATAAGCQLVASCDLAIAAASARFATPGVNIGLFCSTPMVALARAVGRKAAMEMLLTGDLIGADRAPRARAHQSGRAGTRTRRRGNGARDADRRQEPAHARRRQGGILPAGRDAAGRRLQLRLAGNDRQHAGPRRGGWDRRIPRQASPGLDRKVTRADCPITDLDGKGGEQREADTPLRLG